MLKGSASSHAYQMRGGASLCLNQNEQGNYSYSFKDCQGLYLLVLLWWQVSKHLFQFVLNRKK